MRGRGRHATVWLLTALSAFFNLPDATGQDADLTKRITSATPGEAYAKAQKPRRLLVFSQTRGYRHGSIPVGVHALKILGKKTGAFQAIHSEDPEVFEPNTLKQFDAVLLLNTTGELFLAAKMKEMTAPERVIAEKRELRLRKSLLDFVAGGKGLIGIHAATDCFYNWPAYGELIGGYFDGHPWHEKVVIKIDDPGHPLTAPFGEGPLEITDEIYQLSRFSD